MVITRFRKKSGFSLLEVIAGTVILSVIAIGALSAWAKLKRSDIEMHNKKRPLLIAEMKLAEIKALYQNPNAAPVVPATNHGVSGEGLILEELKDGRMWIDAEHMKPTGVTPVPNTGLKKVTVTVKWNPPSVSGTLPTDCPPDRCVKLKTFLFREE